jgi:hypothetical protein
MCMARYGHSRCRRVVAVVAMRRPSEADHPTDLVDEFGVLKAAHIQWRGVFMPACRKSAIFVLPNIGISSLSRSGSG